MANKKDADVAVDMLVRHLETVGIRGDVRATPDGLVVKLAPGGDPRRLPVTCGGHKVRVVG